MLPSTGNFKEINCPFFDSGLCERPYCHFRHVKKDPSEALQNAGSSSISSLSLGENGEILQQLVSEAVRKVLEQTDLPLARTSTPNAVDDVSRNLVTKVTEVLVPPLAAPAPSASTFNASSTQQKIPSYKPTPISLLKQNRHIPIPYCPSLCKTGGILRKRSGSDDASLAQKKIKPENTEASQFSSLYNATSPTASGGGGSGGGSSCSSKSYDTENAVERNVPDDRVGDSFQYLPAPLKGWKDNGLQYTPSSIETLKQQNTYVPSSRTPADVSVAPYEPSEKSKSSAEPIYEPLAANGSSVRGAPYEPSRVSNVEPEYQPLCCDNTAKEYVPTDISKLENIDNEELDITQKIELLHNYLHEEFNSIHSGKQKTSVGGGDLEVTSSDEVLKVVNKSECIKLPSEKIKSDSEKSKNESTKKKSDEKRKRNVRKRGDSNKKSDDRRKSDDKKHSESDRKTENSKKKKESDKKTTDGSKNSSSSSKKKSESDRKSSDGDKKKSESKHKSEHDRGNKEESDKKKSDFGKRSSAEKKQSENSYKKRETEKKRDSVKKRSENEKKKCVSSKHSDVKDKSSSHTNHKHKSNSDLKQSSKSSSSSQNMSKPRGEESKKNSQSNKKSNSQYEKRTDDKISKSEKWKEEVRRKRSDEIEDKHELKVPHKKKMLKELEPDETDSSNEVSFGNSVSESEASDVEDILDSVTLPNDTWASSDEDSVTKECYRIFQEYEPSCAPKKITPVAEPLKEETYVAVVKKQRVAHDGAENSKIIRPVPKRVVGPSPGQTLSERFQKMREMFSSSQAVNPPSTMRSPPLPSTPSIRSPPLPISRYESKAPPQPSLSVPPVGIKKRIAHVPNVSVLLDAKLKMQQKLKEQQMSTDNASKLVGITTKAQSVTKGSQRVAHMPSEQMLKRPIITEMGGKIPSNVRQTYLNILVDEYLKLSPNEQEAFEKAEEEEKSIYSRSNTRAVYASHVSNTINRLRKGAQSSSASTSVKTDGRIVNRTVSHTSMLAGKSGTKGSWSIEKPRKPPSSVTCKSLYEQLLHFVMTEEQMKQNGFPMSHEDEKGVAVIHNFYKKPFVPKTPLQRMCARCSKVYYVNQQGRAVKEENCVYHWGRLFQSKTRGGWEARYSCCQGHGEAIGCSVGACHVSDNFDPSNLRGFVKTLPKEKPPSDGDYGVYALDCEMCYTTVGLELTRVTVIGADLQVVYETLVRPESAILDYNTKFSGIKEEDLEDITTNIYEVQSVLLSFINDKTILIGHSLESDFKALKLIHLTVVDTSVVYPHKMGPPKKRALKTLCRDLLQKIIQESEGGHDSAEDARAAMEIMLYKVKEEMKTSW